MSRARIRAALSVLLPVIFTLADERATLMDLYANTGGASWTRSDGWGSSSSPCSWHGVTCVSSFVSELLVATLR